MSAFRSNKRGSYVIKLVLHGIGHIRKASGTNDAKRHRQYVTMLHDLCFKRRQDVVQLWLDGKQSLPEIWAHYQPGGDFAFPSAADLELLAPQLTEWVSRHDVTEHTREAYEAHTKSLIALQPHAIIRDLPDMVRRARKEYADRAQTFKGIIVVARVFLAATVGKHHPLYIEVGGIPNLRLTPKRHKRPKTVQEAQEIRQRLPGAGGDLWWSLCTTGMRPFSEYTSHKWRIDGHKIVITSGKGGKIRAVPLISTPIPSDMLRVTFNSQLMKLRKQGIQVTPYDARRSYANWLEAARVPRTRRKLYLGHGPKDVTDLYEWHEVDTFVQEDRERLREFIGTDDRMLRVL